MSTWGGTKAGQVHRVTDIQFNFGAIGTHGKHFARNILDVTNGLTIGTGDYSGVSGNGAFRKSRLRCTVGAAGYI